MLLTLGEGYYIIIKYKKDIIIVFNKSRKYFSKIKSENLRVYAVQGKIVPSLNYFIFIIETICMIKIRELNMTYSSPLYTQFLSMIKIQVYVI